MYICVYMEFKTTSFLQDLIVILLSHPPIWHLGNTLQSQSVPPDKIRIGYFTSFHIRKFFKMMDTVKPPRKWTVWKIRLRNLVAHESLSGLELLGEFVNWKDGLCLPSPWPESSWGLGVERYVVWFQVSTSCRALETGDLEDELWSRRLKREVIISGGNPPAMSFKARVWNNASALGTPSQPLPTAHPLTCDEKLNLKRGESLS